MSYLTKPLETYNLSLKNRLVMPPMATAKADNEGKITEDILNYYDEKSKGGYISLIIIEHSFVSPEGKASHRQMSIADDSVIDGLKKLADTIHKNGTKAVMQISHAGSAASKEITGYDPVAPSAIPNPRKGESVPLELTKHQIKDIIQKFKEAAIRVKDAGFDGVEIHSAHGYFLNQFLSPLTNKRTDEYGGDIYGRIRIHLEIIKEIRNAVGNSYPIFLRLGATDKTEGGTTVEDSVKASIEFEKAGVDILDISGGFCGYAFPGEGYFAPVSLEIKKAVNIPVIVTGGIKDVQVAEDILREGKADLIGVGRAILNDSNWTKRAIESLS